MELWDIYDEDRNITGRTHVRGEKLKEGEYHLVVHIWIMNSKGEFLIQKRAHSVTIAPGMWATTGGSAIKGDDSYRACVRETREEIGILPDMANAEILFAKKKDDFFYDVWLIRQDFDICDCKLQVEEVSQVMWVSKEEILAMIHKGEFWPYSYLEDILKLADKY
mgnify:CR=1 FL=1